MLFKILYLLIFWSIDVLLYLWLVRKVVASRKWLIIAVGLWLVFFFFHLPALHFDNLVSFDVYLNMSEMIVVLLMLHFVGQGIIALTKRRQRLPDDVKELSVRAVSIMTNEVIVGFVIFAQLMQVLAARYNGIAYY